MIFLVFSSIYAMTKKDPDKRIIDRNVQRLLKTKNCEGCDLRAAHLEKAQLRGATLTGADLSSAIASGANLVNADLSGAKLYNVRFDKKIQLSGAKLNGADARKAYFDGDMRKMQARKTNFQITHMTGDAREADFTDSNFNYSYLYKLNLEKSLLDNTNFFNAGLDGVRLVGTSTKNTNFLDAQLDNTGISVKQLCKNGARMVNATFNGKMVGPGNCVR